ncbi:hypothetical protein JOL79_16365 [Microbispora sp. RL4-1S]|uniref:Uncharacterized protein n=1 Tax=Microbispora oryzae TaxID=2806554 RepID=A0A940WPZ1_9ACTN|nr:hypothetical protein [Microbispora oryzae]MBP2705390.1 hypothetical protein [Microbispora oryzae]
MTPDVPGFTGVATVRDEPDYLDYYVVLHDSSERPLGILVEEFACAADGTTTGLDGAGWTAADGQWRSSAGFSRRLRRDVEPPVLAVDRPEAAAIYRRLGGGELPGETTLRGHFTEHLALPWAEPLRFAPPEVPEGFHDRRVYRLLFARAPREGAVDRLRDLWRMTTPGADPADPRGRVAGNARRRVAGDSFTWDLRRIGPGISWCVDLTACLATPSGESVGPVLGELTAAMRREGLIPVTVERFS